MNKIFSESHAVWNWLVVSSENPNKVALTVRGLTGLAAVQALFSLLPFLGFHPAFDLASLGDQLYTVVYGGLTLVATVVTLYGAVRKLAHTVTGTGATN